MNKTVSLGILCFVVTGLLNGRVLGETQTTQTKAEKSPVITQILGASLTFTETRKHNSTVIENGIRDLSGKGFSLSWDAVPGPWSNGLLENRRELDHCRKNADLLHRYGMGVAMGGSWAVLLPKNPEKDHDTWVAEYLDPKTGKFKYFKKKSDEMRNWDIGSAEARKAFGSRLKKFFLAVGPFEMFFVDEVVIASPGPKSHLQKISSYWTSHTYSVCSLESFRAYLARQGYPDAARAKFPVTTVEVEPGDRCNMGLPAIPITGENQDRLVADNDWPDSPLWKHWYNWREDLFTSWVDDATRIAYETYGHLPNWQGCMVSYPVHWFTPALGPNPDKLASLKYVDYLVAGYTTGMRYDVVKKAANRHKKKWGGMVELCRYGQQKGRDPKLIVREFKTQVKAGASTMLVYAGRNFMTEFKKPTSSGLYYMPEQVAAWAECIKWLEQGKGYLNLSTVSKLEKTEAGRE